MWKGLGVNYKSSQSNWAADIAYFKSIGLTGIRPSYSNFPAGTYTPGSEIGTLGSIDWWRNCARTFVDNGFFVVHGVAGMPVAAGFFTATTWTQYRLNVLADAAYCQSLGLALDAYAIGNEIEGRIDGTTLTQSQLRDNLKSLATEVKAIYPLAKAISYSCYDAGGTMFDAWIAGGLGDIDILGIHVYGQTGSNGRSSNFTTHSIIGKMIKSFGAERCIITEFGIDANAAQYNQTPSRNRYYCMRHLYAGIRELGYSRAFVYSYVGYLDSNDDFALKSTTGSFDAQWNILLTDGNRAVVTQAGSPISTERVVVPTRTAVTTRLAKSIPAHSAFFEATGNLQSNTISPLDSTALRVGGASDFSIIAHVKPTYKTAQGNNDNATIARLDFSFGNNLGYLIQLHASNGSFRFWSGSTAYDSPAGLVTYGDRQWLSFTLTGTTLRAYVNAGLVWTQTVARKAGDNNASMWFLQENSGAGTAVRGFSGDVYRLLSTKSLLDSSALAAIQTGSYPALDIHYHFTRGAGKWVADLSGNDNHGFLGAESWATR